MIFLLSIAVCAELIPLPQGGAAAPGTPSWAMVTGDIVSRWAKEVSPTNVLPEHPRPVMRRPNWNNLNGLWEFAVGTVDDQHCPKESGVTILVPFCAESALSGIKRIIRETDRLWFRRSLQDVLHRRD